MLDFTDTHETEVQERRNQAARLLESLTCMSETGEGAVHGPGKHLDFAEAPPPESKQPGLTLGQRARGARWRAWRAVSAGVLGTCGLVCLIGLVLIIALGLAPPGQARADGAYWTRRRARLYLEPQSLRSLQPMLEQQGWA